MGTGAARDAEIGMRERWSAGINGQTGEWGCKEARNAEEGARVLREY